VTTYEKFIKKATLASCMNRREFLWKSAGAGLVAAVAPELVLAGEDKKKEEEKPAMYAYPWDVVYKSKEQVNSAKYPKKIVESQKLKLEDLARTYDLFKNPDKIKKIFPSMLDKKINNEELSALFIWDDGFGLRILTTQNITEMENKVQSEIDKYGPSKVYVVKEKMSKDKIEKVLTIFK